MNNLLDSQVKSMLALQCGMNSKVDAAWVSACYPYLRAVVIEGAEAIEHHGWKWWKHQQHDLSQLKMELIDIWHFLLSEILLECGADLEQAAANLMAALTGPDNGTVVFDGRSYKLEQLDLLAKLELLIGTCVSRRVEVGLFAAIMADCRMSWEDLYRQYVGKNVLNFFRQDHGYKLGTYTKLWNGKEDNQHLVEVLNSLDSRAADFQDQLYLALEERYPVAEQEASQGG